MKKPTKNIIGQGAIVRSLRKPKPKKSAPPVFEVEIEKKEEKDC